MEESILTSTKKILSIGPDDDSFDLDVITHINSTFSTLNQLGVGSDRGFEIKDDTAKWSQLGLDLPMTNAVRTYVYLKVRMLFDPPTTQFLMASMEKQIEQAEWRISVRREATDWVNPDPEPETQEAP